MNSLRSLKISTESIEFELEDDLMNSIKLVQFLLEVALGLEDS